MFENKVVRLGNWVTRLRLRRTRVAPEKLLLLFPHCLQWSECPHNVTAALSNCRRCGRCRIGDLLDLADVLGVPCALASGGREAVRRVKAKSVKAVLAVACEKELCEGMIAVLPKPVIGVVNLLPHGPCKDTDCNLEEVKAALEAFLLPPTQEAKTAQDAREKDHA